MKRLTRNSNLDKFFYSLVKGEEFLYASSFDFAEVSAEANKHGLTVESVVGVFGCRVTATHKDAPGYYSNSVLSSINVTPDPLTVASYVRNGVGKLPEVGADNVLRDVTPAEAAYKRAKAALVVADAELRHELTAAVSGLKADWSEAEIGTAFGLVK